MGMVFRSGIYATLGATLNVGDATITLTASQGARFNTWLATQYDYTWLTVIKMSDANKPYERIRVRGPLTGDVIPVVARAQDGTTALSFNSGERVEVRLCAPMLERFVESEDIQTLADVRATSVGGTPNAITAVHTYPLSELVGVGNAPTDGMTSLFQPAAANTAMNPTYSPDGLSAREIRRHNGRQLKPGDLSATSPALVTFRGGAMNAWLLMNPDVDQDFVPNARSSGFTLDRTVYGRTIVCTGTFTITVDPAATLGSDFWCAIVNHGTGVITINANGSERIHLPGGPNGGLSSMALPWSGTSGPTNVGAIVIASDGSALRVVSSSETHGRLFVTTTQDWICPLNVNTLFLSMVGGGGGGATTVGPGSTGGPSSFGALVTVGGGGGGIFNSTIGGAGGTGDFVGQRGGDTNGGGGSGPFGRGGRTGGQLGVGNAEGFGSGGCGAGGGSGGAGGYVYRKPISVVPGTTYAITLGAGGSGNFTGAPGAALLEW